MKIGIIGLPQSGKTMVFKAVCPHHQESHIGLGKMEVRRGIVKVPDDRIADLVKIYEPAKITFAEIEFMDVSGVSGKSGDISRSETDIPPALREPEVLAHVVRAFESDIVIHPEGSVDALRDIQNVEAELIFNDFIVTETRLEKISRYARMVGYEKIKREMVVLEKVKAHLEEDKPIREMELTVDERKTIKGFQFLSQKAKLIILSVGEDDISRMDEIVAEHEEKVSGRDIDIVAMCAGVQAELAELEEEDRQVFMEDMGLSESALDKMIRKSFSLLGLITFFTGGPTEVHAWIIPNGTKAPQAAGAIHQDFEKGFIKAEIYTYDDLMKYGNEAEAKKHGCLHIEGKEYVFKDGDTVLFRFNV